MLLELDAITAEVAEAHAYFENAAGPQLPDIDCQGPQITGLQPLETTDRLPWLPPTAPPGVRSGVSPSADFPSQIWYRSSYLLPCRHRLRIIVLEILPRISHNVEHVAYCAAIGLFGFKKQVGF